MGFVKNTDNPKMLVFYLNKHRNKIVEIASAPEGTYRLTDLYRTVRPAFVEAPSKPYTNNFINKFGNTVRRGKASSKSQAKNMVNLLNRNDTLFGYGGGHRKPFESKYILSDEELNTLEQNQ